MSHSSHHRLSASRIIARFFFAMLCFALAGLMVFHQQIPDVLGLGLIIDNLAPWMGVGIPVLFLMALVVRGRISFISLLVPIVVWAVLFGPAFIPSAQPVPEASLRLATQNVHESAGAQAARELADHGAQVIALQEIGEDQEPEISAELAKSHPYRYMVSTVGVWSAYPLKNPEPLDLGLGWDRALRVDVATEQGDIRVYAVHAASARPTGHHERDKMLASLGDYFANDDSPRIIAAGDFNATSTDRHFAPVADQLEEAHYSDWGLALTWPRTLFPMLGIDHVMLRGVQSAGMERLEVADSDHYALAATIDLGN
ncbi:endonuclease/exonuclease/phosphatase family protein [Glutamicibacter sp. MCAF14]|uniref:endonuclease/exonuclease/phosphatase family protein n=1 Tax=Glutamicibacter sp. MCAF14 TaxID=3233043 RepID=UPI003F8DAF75